MNAQVPFTCPAHLQLEISKAVYQLDFFARSIQLPGWPSPADIETWKHDLGVMRAFDDLKRISLELLDDQGAVLHEFQITFGHAPVGGKRVVDSAQGVEVVVLSAQERQQIRSFRFLVRYHRHDDSYKHLLKLNWSPADARLRRAQHGYDSEHAQRITGGAVTAASVSPTPPVTCCASSRREHEAMPLRTATSTMALRTCSATNATPPPALPCNQAA